MRKFPCALVAAMTLPAAAQVSFQGLGTLPGPTGPMMLISEEISTDGSTIIGRTWPTSGPNPAFRWTRQAGAELIGSAFGSNTTHPRGISADTTVIVGAAQGVVHRPFSWTQSTGFVELPTPSGEDGASANGVSADGRIIIGESFVSSRGSLAVRWTANGAVENLGTLPGDTASQAWAMSPDGRFIVGTSSVPSPTRPYRWIEGQGMQSIDVSPHRFATPFAVSDDGAAVVGVCFPQNVDYQRAFRWTESGGVEILGLLPGMTMSYAVDISADGEVVIGHSQIHAGPTVSRAFVWTPESGMLEIGPYLSGLGVDLTGWELTHAIAISADGRTLTGRGTHNGQFESWVVVIPAPASAAVLLSPLLFIRRRRPWHIHV